MRGIALIGAGGMGAKRSLAIANHSDSELRYVIDIQAESAKELADRYGAKHGTDLQAAIQDDSVDAVVVSVTHRDLVSASKIALQAGKHVFCEKPLALHYEDGLRLKEAVQHAASQFRVGYTLRSYPGIQEAQQLLQREELGRLIAVRMLYGHGGRPGYSEEWRFEKSLSGGGQLVDQGSHLIDLALWTLDPILEVQAQLANFFWENRDGLEDYAQITLESRSGQLANLTASWVQWRNHFSCQWICEQGYLIAEGLSGSYGEQKLIIGKREQLGQVPIETVRTYPMVNPFQEEWDQFMNALDGKHSVLPTYEEALRVLGVILACYRAAQAKAAISCHEEVAKCIG